MYNYIERYILRESRNSIGTGPFVNHSRGRAAVAGLAAAMILAALPAALRADQVPNPVVTASSTPYSSAYTAGNLFLPGQSEFAVNAQGFCSAPLVTNPASGTWVELDFGRDVTFDRFIFATRYDGASLVGNNRLYVGDNPVHSTSDTIFTFGPLGYYSDAPIQYISSVTGRYVRWEILSGQANGYLGGRHMWFLNSPTNMNVLLAPTVISATAPYSSTYAATHAMDGKCGADGSAEEYAINSTISGLTNVMVVFDFGSTNILISGCDFLNRELPLNTSFTLTFGNDPTFAVTVATNTFNCNPTNGNAWNTGTFPAIAARYVQFQNTGVNGTANPGMREMVFYGPAQPPSIIQDPQSATNYLYDIASLSVTAGGPRLPLAYQWYQNGTNLAGATSRVLTLSNLQFSAAGSYVVVVTNVYGSVTSAPAVMTVSNPPVDLQAGLVAYYAFDETNGTTAADSSTNGYSATLTNYPDQTSMWGPGRIGGALALNLLTTTTNQYVATDLPLAFADTNNFTFSFWEKLANASNPYNPRLITPIGTNHWVLWSPNVGVGFYPAAASPGPQFGHWTHFVVTYNRPNGIYELYVNGAKVLKAQSASYVKPVTDLQNPWIIGNDENLSRNLDCWRGYLDDVRIYNRVIYPTEALALYQLATTEPPTFTVAPQSQNLWVGETLNLSAVVDGTLPIAFQWQKNGTNIPGAVFAQLVIDNMQLTNAGPYTLTASNQVQTASATAVITVTNFNLTNMVAGWWKFDDGAGTTALDSSTNGNNGALDNFPGDDSGWVPGLIGPYALNFINIPATPQEYVSIPDSPSLNFDSTLKFTLSAWVKGSPGQINGAGIICKGFGWGGEQYCMDISINSMWRFFCHNASGSTVSITPTNAATGQWQHLAVAFDGVAGFIRMYVNGQLVGTNAAPTSLLANSHEVSIGNRPYTNDNVYNLPLTGQIDDVRIYTRALSATDVQALYAQAPLLPVVFYRQPVGSARWVGDNVLLSALADGTPPLTYQWQQGGTNVPGATAASLLLTNLQLTDAGNYSLQVSNAAGPSNSAIAALSVSVFDLSNTVAYWKFDDGSGTTAADASGNGNPGTLNNFPGDNSEWVTGRIAGGLNFNGDGSGANYVSIPDAPGLNFDTRLTFSLAAWVKGSPIQTNSAGIICKGLGWGGEEYALDYTFNSVANGYRFFVCNYNAAGTAVTLASPVAPNGRWQHLVGVFDGFAGTMQLYVNGQLLVGTNAAPTSLPANTHEVSIGSRQYGQSGAATYDLPFTGIIDDVRIYNRALKSAEVQQLYALAGTLAPVVYTQPQSVTNYAHGRASFSVVADGTGALSYQWLKNGATVSGATTASLAFADLQMADAGTYSVQVTDANNSSVLSSNASLTVLSLPAPDLTTELIAYWAFDETSGTTAYDSSGQGNDALLINFPPGDAQWVPGVIGGALHFSNGGDPTDYGNYRVGTANPLTLDNGNLFTFSFWAKLDPGAATSGSPRFITPINGQNWVLWSPGRGVGFSVPANSTEPSSNAWHHFVVLFNRPAGTYSLFVDGARQVTDAGGYARNDPTSSQWFIGHSETATSTTDSLTGLLDDLRVYNRLLNYNDIQALYFLAGAPRMSVTNNGSSVTVSWPAGATGFHLQSVGALTGVVWSNEPAPPVPSADGASQSLVFSDQAAARFYRLQKP